MKRLSQFLRRYRAPLFLSLGLALFFWPVWIKGYTFPRGGGDLWGQLYPVWSYVARFARQGILAMWNPQIMAGDPIIGEPQYGVLNPLNWGLFLLSPIPRWAILLRGIAPLWIAGAGMYLYLRRSPVWRLETSAALVGALAYMLSDPFITHLGHPQINEAMGWLPWSLLAIDGVLAQTRFTPLVCLPLALMAVAGHYQTTLYGSVAVSLYALWRLLESPRQHWLRNAGRLALTALLALGMAAPVLLPSLERYPFTERAFLQLQHWEGYQWPLAMGIDLLAPDFHGRGVTGFWAGWARVEGGYVGAVALYLALLGIASGWRKRRTWFLLALGTLAVLFALGYAGPIYAWAARIDMIMRIGKTARCIYLLAFVLALGAAQGMEALRRQPGWRGWFWGGALLLLTGFLWWRAPVWTLGVPEGARRAQALQGLNFAALLAALTAFLGLASRIPSRRWGRAALPLLLLAELTATGAFVETESALAPDADPHAAAIAYLRGDSGWFRVDVDAAARGLWSPGAIQAAGFESPQGSGNPMELITFNQFYWATPTKGAPSYQLVGAKYIVVPKGALPGGEGIWPVFSDDPQIDLHLNTRAMNRVWLVYDTLPVTRLEEAYDHVFAADFDPLHTATLENGPDLNGAGQGVLEVPVYGPNRVHIRASVNAPALVVLSDLHYPGWQATLDGRPTVLYKTDGLFRGVVVPPGDHVIEMRYFSLALRLGLGLWALAVWGACAPGFLARLLQHKASMQKRRG